MENFANIRSHIDTTPPNYFYPFTSSVMPQVIPPVEPDAYDTYVIFPQKNSSLLTEKSFNSLRTNVSDWKVVPIYFHSIQFQYVGLASYVILIWDHIDTFADEVS